LFNGVCIEPERTEGHKKELEEEEEEEERWNKKEK